MCRMNPLRMRLRLRIVRIDRVWRRVGEWGGKWPACRGLQTVGLQWQTPFAFERCSGLIPLPNAFAICHQTISASVEE